VGQIRTCRELSTAVSQTPSISDCHTFKPFHSIQRQDSHIILQDLVQQENTEPLAQNLLRISRQRKQITEPNSLSTGPMNCTRCTLIMLAFSGGSVPTYIYLNQAEPHPLRAARFFSSLPQVVGKIRQNMTSNMPVTTQPTAGIQWMLAIIIIIIIAIVIFIMSRSIHNSKATHRQEEHIPLFWHCLSANTALSFHEPCESEWCQLELLKLYVPWTHSATCWDLWNPSQLSKYFLKTHVW
jgi:hypothetical protein